MRYNINKMSRIKMIHFEIFLMIVTVTVRDFTSLI